MAGESEKSHGRPSGVERHLLRGMWDLFKMSRDNRWRPGPSRLWTQRCRLECRNGGRGRSPVTGVRV